MKVLYNSRSCLPCAAESTGFRALIFGTDPMAAFSARIQAGKRKNFPVLLFCPGRRVNEYAQVSGLYMLAWKTSKPKVESMP